MKIVVFDWENSDITVNLLSKDEEDYLLKNGEDCAFKILDERGYYTQNPSLNWMIVDSDLPVFNHGDPIPFCAL